jgi:hypothetical protein
MHAAVDMRTVLIRGGDEPPSELRHIVETGSTEVLEVADDDGRATRDADRIVIWNGHDVIVEDRRLRWPEDEDELRLLFQH